MKPIKTNLRPEEILKLSPTEVKLYLKRDILLARVKAIETFSEKDHVDRREFLSALNEVNFIKIRQLRCLFGMATKNGSANYRTLKYIIVEMGRLNGSLVSEVSISNESFSKKDLFRIIESIVGDYNQTLFLLHPFQWRKFRVRL